MEPKLHDQKLEKHGKSHDEAAGVGQDRVGLEWRQRGRGLKAWEFRHLRVLQASGFRC